VESNLCWAPQKRACRSQTAAPVPGSSQRDDEEAHSDLRSMPRNILLDRMDEHQERQAILTKRVARCFSKDIKEKLLSRPSRWESPISDCPQPPTGFVVSWPVGPYWFAKGYPESKSWSILRPKNQASSAGSGIRGDRRLQFQLIKSPSLEKFSERTLNLDRFPTMMEFGSRAMSDSVVGWDVVGAMRPMIQLAGRSYTRRDSVESATSAGTEPAARAVAYRTIWCNLHPFAPCFGHARRLDEIASRA